MELISRVRQIFYIFTKAKHEWKCDEILSHEWNNFYIQSQNMEFSVYYIFGFFLLISFKTSRCCMQYMMWRHNRLLFSFCENISQCENYSLRRYHFYSLDKYILFITVTWPEVQDHVKLTGTDHQIKRCRRMGR